MDALITNLDVATTHVISLTDLSKNSEIQSLLKFSAAKLRTDTTITIYRTYFVAANLLSQDIETHTFKEVDKTVFTGLTKPIESWLNLQAAIDMEYLTEIPVGFEAIEKETICMSAFSA